MKLEYMKKAIEIAKTSQKDIPVGAIIVRNGEIISSAVNEREKEKIAINHAEILAILRANKKLKSWRLKDCEMYVTLEPCPMCASAIIQARIKAVYFGAYDMLNGAMGSKTDMCELMNTHIEVKGGILEEDCTNLLKEYFIQIRN